MFEAYAIGVTLKLHNLISPQLTVLAQEFARLDALTSTLNANLRKVGAESAGLRAVAAAGRSSSTAMERAAFSAARLERRLIAVRLAAHNMPPMLVMPPMPPMLPGGGGRVPGIPGGGGAGGGGGGGGHGGGRGAFGQYAHGGNIHMGPGGIGVGTVGMSAGGAFVPIAIGAAMAYGGHALYEAAKDLDTEKQRFKLFGLSNAQNEDAFKFVGGMNAYGTTQAQNMKAFREAQGVFRESGATDGDALKSAKLMAPMMAKLEFASAALDGESQAKLKTANMSMLRYVEMSGGVKSPADAARIVELGWRLNQTSGGTVDWEQLRQFKTTAGTSGYKITNDGMALLEPLMAELKGGGAGTALATAYGRISGLVRLPNQAAHALVDNGLWDKSKVEFNANGGIKRMTGNPLNADSQKLLGENPVQFYISVMKPVYAKMKLSADEIMRENSLIFGRNGGKFFNALDQAMPAIEHAIGAIKKASGLDASVEIAKGGAAGPEKEFISAWTDFKANFGTSMLPFFTGVLKGGASILRAIATVQDKQAGDSNWSKFGDLMSGKTTRSVYDTAFPGTSYGRPGNVGDNPAEHSGFVARQAGGGRGFINNTINIDGRKVAEVVTQHQSSAAGRPQAGTNGFDGRRALTPAGATGGW